MKSTSKILVIGSSNTDMTVKSPMIPRPGETVIGGEFKIGAGGKGANKQVYALLGVMFVLFIAGLGFIIAAGN